jgi:demethylmenaquinone methyltransferase/2-methoxy-6-polyprenyl-1,4-benzoquinol methylase
MLELGRKKIEKEGLANKIELLKGDGEAISFPDNSFDAVTVAFGVRNFGDLHQGLKEIQRVLRPGAPLVVLEFTKPRIFPFKQLFNIYFKHILPLIGSWTSGDGRAYKYLYESVQAFPDYYAFNQELIRAGFEKPSYKPLSLGICAIYIAYKH